jgi:glutamate/tyrosine decarboxylase-like PLP-dependent enzyme
MDPIADPAGSVAPLTQVYEAARPYLAALPALPAVDREVPTPAFSGALPRKGIGAAGAVAELIAAATTAATQTSGPHFHHFVVGGATPAAMAADWLTSLVDQNAALRQSSAFAARVEEVALRWLVELLELPDGWGGALTTDASAATVAGLGAATHWWGERLGVDVGAVGLSGLPRMSVLSGGFLQPATRNALQSLGHGRDAAELYTVDSAGRVDLSALRSRLAGLDGPAIIVGTAGEVSTGACDPLDALADLAAEYRAWLHVDAAYGALALLSPRTAGLLRGVNRADSLSADAHTWLNVPYESGFALLREPSRLTAAFGTPTSARARALPIWATLAAYGRDGCRSMVERMLDRTTRLAALVDEAPDLDRLAPAPLCTVCFRYRPGGLDAPALDKLNRRLGQEIRDDGRVYVSTTVHCGSVALRASVVNWRVTDRDIDHLVYVVRETAHRL